MQYLPNFYEKSTVVQSVMNSIGNEAEACAGMAGKLFYELHAATAERYVDLWEQSVGIPVNTDLTVEERRSRVLARLRQIDATTPERIAAIARSYSRGDVEIVENFSEYIVTIRFVNRIGKPDNMSGLIEQLNQIMPAHLQVNYEYPFRTWGQIADLKNTWEQISAYTWEEIMSKEVL